MRRRNWLLAPCFVPAMLNGQSSGKPREYITAAASRDTAPRIGLIPSHFTGSEEQDGRKIRALAKPAPLTEPLTAAQLDDMLRLAVELGGGRRGGLTTAIGADDWVLIKIQAQGCQGTATDPRLLASLLRYLAEHNLGRRITIAARELCGSAVRTAVYAAAKQYPKLRLELLDLASASSLRMPVEGRIFASRNPEGIYTIPRVLRECDKLISVAPPATRAGSQIGLAMMNYLDFASGDTASLGDPGEVAIDLFSFHPADYAIVGGSTAFGSAGERRHNLIIAGTSALAVDAVGAAVMGFESDSIRHLELAVKRGYGTNDSYSIWTRGVEIDEVKADFTKP